MPLVSVVMGSDSDKPFMQGTIDILSEMGIECEMVVMSAHRNPEAVREFGQTARQRGIEVIVAGAGAAAHLPGVLASWTTIPVIGVPLPTSDLNGVDSLYAIVQMPAGIPVATVAIGKAGAKNAAYLAAQILGLKFDRIRQSYEDHRRRLAQPMS
ncbi:MAG: 5-(carboxyamino)imidazole ribonucleotide mutase [Chloroflexi bacterium]|nr:5-(carboxyamino)imidazole ribonucleotide mutase [Chloroflexota bacterium]